MKEISGEWVRTRLKIRLEKRTIKDDRKRYRENLAKIYMKKEIKEEVMYDNRPSSLIIYRARANCPKLNESNRHQGGEVGCKLCGANIENLEHFLLECEVLGEERNATTL